MSSANVKIYMETLAKTATNGNVVVTFAWLAQRMELYCQKCRQTLTAPSPTDETIDYAVQEFLKLHLHQAHATWCACEKCHPQEEVGYQSYVMGMNLAFEKPGQPKVENIESPYGDYSDEDYGLTNLPKAAKTVAEPVIDKNATSAAILKAKLAEFKKEYAEKGDQESIKKIQEMQKKDLEKAKLLAAEQKQMQAEEAEKVVGVSASYYDKIMVQKFKNYYALKTLENFKAKVKKAEELTYWEVPEPVPVEVKKDKPLKDKQGRKFR